jgi:hypothetical protein
MAGFMRFRSGLGPTVLGAILVLAGCQGKMVQQTVVAQHGGDSPDEQLEFWHSLNDAPVASNDDAFHALLLYVDGSDPNADYAARVGALKGRGMLPADFNEPANRSITRGTLAVAIVKALQIRGGLMMHLLGPIPRYAVRELYSEGLYPLSSPHQTFSGAEVVGIMGRVEDYQRGNPNTRPAAQLPSDPQTPAAPE